MDTSRKTREPQYGILLDAEQIHGRARLGLMVNQGWADDPKRLVFTLARYKFVAKLLEGRSEVLEVGCADAFGTRVVQQHVASVTAVDFDPVFIQDVLDRADPSWPLKAMVHDLLKEPVVGSFDAAYALDVLEHIQPGDEDRFIRNIIASLRPNGVLILGMPSLESQTYASPQSRAGHVNCKSAAPFKKLMEDYFHTVFMFSMNDEVVHTGYAPMAHYLLAVCSSLRVAGAGTPS